MKKRLVAVFSTVLLLFGIGAVAAGPASAGTCTIVTSTWHLCGSVKSLGNCPIRVVNNWPASYGTVKTLYQGQTSTRFFRDTDGYFIPTNCKVGVAIRKGVWVKITNVQTVGIRATY